MKSIQLKAELRKNLGKKDAKALRKESKVPCVLYGGKENIHFCADEKSFKDIVYTHHIYAIDIEIGGKQHKAIMKEIQFHPVTDSIEHIDFVEVIPSKPIIVNLPIEITGNSIGVKAGGKVRQRKRSLKVKGLVENLPDSLVIDITDLNIGETILAGDVKYDKVEILEPARAMVVGVLSSRAAAKGMEEGTEGASTAATTAAPAEAKK